METIKNISPLRSLLLDGIVCSSLCIKGINPKCFILFVTSSSSKSLTPNNKTSPALKVSLVSLVRYFAPFLHNPSKLSSSYASFKKNSYFLPINLDPGVIIASISSKSSSSKEWSSFGIEKSKTSRIEDMSSGGVLITKIWPAFILKLFFTFFTPPVSLTIPRTSVSSPASFLKADKVIPIAELDSFTSTSNK